MCRGKDDNKERPSKAQMLEYVPIQEGEWQFSSGFLEWLGESFAGGYLLRSSVRFLSCVFGRDVWIQEGCCGQLV